MSITVHTHSDQKRSSLSKAAFGEGLLYLWDFDRSIASICDAVGALYQRYSDDILIVCPVAVEGEIEGAIKSELAAHKLTLAADKTDRQIFDSHNQSVFQYLGFNISSDGAVIRPSSLARQWRKAKRSIQTTKRAGLAAIANGKAKQIFVRKLRQRFSPVGALNFSSYARRADNAFNSKNISRQVARLERKIDLEIRDLQKYTSK